MPISLAAFPSFQVFSLTTVLSGVQFDCCAVVRCSVSSWRRCRTCWACTSWSCTTGSTPAWRGCCRRWALTCWRPCRPKSSAPSRPSGDTHSSARFDEHLYEIQYVCMFAICRSCSTAVAMTGDKIVWRHRLCVAETRLHTTISSSALPSSSSIQLKAPISKWVMRQRCVASAMVST